MRQQHRSVKRLEPDHLTVSIGQWQQDGGIFVVKINKLVIF